MRGTLENLLNHVIDACPSSFSGSKHQVSFVLCVESDYFRPAFFLCLRTFTNSFLYCASSKPKPGFLSRDSLIPHPLTIVEDHFSLLFHQPANTTTNDGAFQSSRRHSFRVGCHHNSVSLPLFTTKYVARHHGDGT